MANTRYKALTTPQKGDQIVWRDLRGEERSGFFVQVIREISQIDIIAGTGSHAEWEVSTSDPCGEVETLRIMPWQMDRIFSRAEIVEE